MVKFQTSDISLIPNWLLANKRKYICAPTMSVIVVFLRREGSFAEMV